MARYRLLFKRSVAKDLRSIPPQDVVRILQCCDALAENPRRVGCEKLSDQEQYRIRVGVYRIVYTIHDDVLEVVVVRVGHRRDVYRRP